MPAQRALASLALLALGACGPARLPADKLNDELPWPDGLAPMVGNVATYPAAAGGEPYPETLSFEFADVEGIDAAVHARGFLHAPLADVRDAMHTPEVVIDRRRVTSWEVTNGSKPAFPVSFHVRNTVVDLATFDFHTDWWMSPVAATGSTPEAEVARQVLAEPNDFQKILDVSVVAKRTSDMVTAVEFERHTKALVIGEREAQLSIEDLFASLKAAVHGEPLPKY
jgi:hypothetical protein